MEVSVREHSLLAMPALLGFVLIGVAFVDLYQFRNGTVGVGDMLARELPVVLMGFLGCLLVFGRAIRYFLRKLWLDALLSLASIMVFLISYAVAGVSGGAFLNAT